MLADRAQQGDGRAQGGIIAHPQPLQLELTARAPMLVADRQGRSGLAEPWLIGKAISHGCVRMHNKDILEVSRLVPTGSPVIIQK